MSVDDSYALFITWSTYGTWLPGDERGHVSDRARPHLSPRPKQNRPSTPYAAGHEYVRRLATQRQAWPTVHLDAAQASIVAASLVQAATDRQW